MSAAAMNRSKRAASALAAPEAANDNGGSGNPTIVDLPGEIPEDRRRRFAEVLARILVTRALVALGMRAAIEE
jgi:hypothetical protein